MRGFLVSLTNPKTLLFYAAFLLQFVSPAAPPDRPDFDAFGYVRHNGCVPGWAVRAVGWTVAPAS
jgi:threonine/homoserine/homoserine lactone efflux protein